MNETNKKIQKIGNIALTIGILAIFFEDLLPILSYVSMGGIIISYLTNLFNEYAVNKKVSPISVLLCAAVIFWLIAGNVFKNPYAPVLGRGIIYAYLLYTSYQILKRINKGFIIFATISTGLCFLTVIYDNKVMQTANLLFSIFVILKFLDPILEKIALRHRAKRMAAMAENPEYKESALDKAKDATKTLKDILAMDD